MQLHHDLDCFFFFFNDTATTEIYTLSLHDALPISYETGAQEHVYLETQGMIAYLEGDVLVVKGSMQCPYYVLKDRKSTRLNSSHGYISYAVFCLKKKNSSSRRCRLMSASSPLTAAR